MIEHTLLLWTSAVPLMGSPGPATLSLAAIGSAFGFSRGIPYLAGIVFGTTGVLILIASGLTTMLLAAPGLIGVLSILAAGYILYLAWKIATAPVGAQESRSAASPAMLPGFVLAIANPKAFAAIGAVYASHTIVQADLALDTAAKTFALFLVIVLVNTSWLAMGALFASMLTDPVIGRITNIGMAVILVISVCFALLLG